jgi:hypothetical protein
MLYNPCQEVHSFSGKLTAFEDNKTLMDSYPYGFYYLMQAWYFNLSRDTAIEEAKFEIKIIEYLREFYPLSSSWHSLYWNYKNKEHLNNLYFNGNDGIYKCFFFDSKPAMLKTFMTFNGNKLE